MSEEDAISNSVIYTTILIYIYDLGMNFYRGFPCDANVVLILVEGSLLRKNPSEAPEENSRVLSKSLQELFKDQSNRNIKLENPGGIQYSYLTRKDIRKNKYILVTPVLVAVMTHLLARTNTKVTIIFKTVCKT